MRNRLLRLNLGQDESKPADDAMDAEFEEVKEDDEDKSKEEKN